MKYAVIDIGSNSVRLMLDGDSKVNRKILKTTQLAKGMNSGVLLKDKIVETAAAVKELFDFAENLGYEVMIYATEAVRSAKNGSDLTALILDATGKAVDVIDGNTEATIGFLGACGKIGNKCILDVGGASSELAAGRDGKIYYSKSLPFGAVRLKDKFGDDLPSLRKYLQERAQEYKKIECDEHIAISGTATSLAAMMLGLKVYDPTAVHGSFLPTEYLEKLLNDLYGKPPAFIAEAFPAIGVKRAEVILCGAAVIAEVAKYLGVRGFTVSERDNAEGYLIFKEKISL